MFVKEIRADAHSLHMNLRGASIFFWGWRVVRIPAENCHRATLINEERLRKQKWQV